jgi:hypothetical protein
MEILIDVFFLSSAACAASLFPALIWLEIRRSRRPISEKIRDDAEILLYNEDLRNAQAQYNAAVQAEANRIRAGRSAS